MISDKLSLALVEQYKRVDRLKSLLHDFENGNLSPEGSDLGSYSDTLIQYEKELSTLNGLLNAVEEPVDLLLLSQRFT